jgi:Flp pilus assembly pilin Flp
MLSRWRGRKAKLRNERGAAMAEYTPLLAVIALALFFSVSFFGPWVANHLGIAALSVEYGAYVAGDCPSGGYNLTYDEGSLEKVNGKPVNVNGDEFICDKDVPGDPGNGNTDQNHDVKDNNNYPWDGG